MSTGTGQVLNSRISGTQREFKLLSMTELRSSPGEILDRVANGDEAFIIERNGQRKACLVPLSVFFPDISPARIAEEFDVLERHGEVARTSISGNRELVFSFRQEIAGHDALELTIVLPHGYPSRCPRVFVTPLEAGVPHRWADGALCLFGVMSLWNPGKHTVHSTLSLARRWLERYAVWLKTGQWPKVGTAHE